MTSSTAQLSARHFYVHSNEHNSVTRANRYSKMAEVIGIVAAAIAFAKAATVALDAMSKIKDAPKNIQELQYELRDLQAVLEQIGSTPSWRQGDPIETALRSCLGVLEQLRDLVAPPQHKEGDNAFKLYVKGLRLRPKASEIQSAVKRLQSQKLTLALALISSIPRLDSNSYIS